MAKLPPQFDHILKVARDLRVASLAGDTIRGERIGYVARAINNFYTKGKRHTFTIRQNALAFVLMPLKPASPGGLPPNVKHDAVKGEKVYCRCLQKPKMPYLCHKTGTHRGLVGVISKDAMARVRQPLRFVAGREAKRHPRR